VIRIPSLDEKKIYCKGESSKKKHIYEFFDKKKG